MTSSRSVSGHFSFLVTLAKVLSCGWGGVETCSGAVLLAGGYLKVW